MDTETLSQIAEVESQLVSLKKIRASGVFSVRHGDESIQYSSLADINKAIAALNKELRVLKGETRKPGYILQTSKGL